MPDEKELFQTVGLSWSERAGLGELDAVLTATGQAGKNEFLHHVHSFFARKALKWLPADGTAVDFGCGTGRFTRFFAGHSRAVIGTEVTVEMLRHGKQIGFPRNAETALTDGVNIPVRNESVDLIWICGVLRYSLNVPNPVYADIAREMYRCLKPGGRVVNLEVYVEQPPSDFTRDFERTGFVTEKVALANWHHRHPEKLIQSARFPMALVPFAATIAAALRYHLSSAQTTKSGVRTYLFVWRKPSR